MTRADEHYARYNLNFSDKRKNKGGRLLSYGLSPIETPVTFITGKTYEIVFDYLCNVPGCKILYNFYKNPDVDLPHHTKELEYSENFRTERLVLVCGGGFDVQQMNVRLWSNEPKKKVFIRDVKVSPLGGVEGEKYERQVHNAIQKREDQFPIFPGDFELFNKDKLKKAKLKNAPITFLAYVKDEGKYYLERMIKSFIDYVPNLVIVDTGSTDSSFEIYEKYQDRDNFTLINHPCSEKEIYKGINAAIAECKTDWIFITAGDEAMLKEDLFKIPDAIEKAKKKKVRAVRVSYLDFIGDDKHYHTKYHCLAYRIWRNFKGFHFGGDFQGDIYMAYDDGIQTGGVETKKNMPDRYTLECLDIFFHHYARCKPKDVLLEKRIKYYARRLKKPTEQNVLDAAKSCPFYTLDPKRLKIKEYNGPQAGMDEPTKKLKIGFYTYTPDIDHFAQPILKRLKRDGHKVKITYKLKDLETMYNTMDWIWFEWGEKWLIDVLSIKRKAKIIVRIHRYEIERSFARKINWNNADILWFVNDDVKNMFIKKLPNVTTKMIVIPNAVDSRQMKWQDRKKYTKNIILYAIRFSKIKDFETAIRIFDKVVEFDPEFSMTLRAMTPSKQILDKLKKMAEGKKIKFITNPVDLKTIDDKTDVNALLKGQDIFLSTSTYESFHYAIAESLASGLQVFVRNWERGGKPEDFWAPYLCNSEKEMAQKIIEWSKLPVKEKAQISFDNRKYVINNFGADVITEQLLESLKLKQPPHVGVIIPLYNNEKYVNECIDSLLNQSYKFITIIVVNDGSTDNTINKLKKYGDRIVIINKKNGGPHSAMNKGIEFAKTLNVDYTIFDGSDDVYNPDYIEKMVKRAEDTGAYLVYPNFDIIDGDGNNTGKFISQPPDIDVLRKDCYICDHSLTSAEFWNAYDWHLRFEKFKAYSVFHALLSSFKMFPNKQEWINEFLWNYREHGKNIHIDKKKERQGQRQAVVVDIFGDE